MSELYFIVSGYSALFRYTVPHQDDKIFLGFGNLESSLKDF